MTTRAEIRTFMGKPDLPRAIGLAGAIVWFGCVLVPLRCPVMHSALVCTLCLEGAGCAGAGRFSLDSGSTKRDANSVMSGCGGFDGRMVWILSGCTLLHLGDDAWPSHLSQRKLCYCGHCQVL
jgi:hypothetical protein